MQTIGIDVGKRQHIAAICHEGEREARKAVLRFGSDRAGLAELGSWLERHGPIDRAVLESSGQDHLNLAAALQRQGVPVAVVNPLESKYFARRRLQRTKSDPADARTPALLAMVDQPEIRDVLAGAELREAARFSMTVVHEQARLRQRITRLIELGFPMTIRPARVLWRSCAPHRPPVPRRTPTGRPLPQPPGPAVAGGSARRRLTRSRRSQKRPSPHPSWPARSPSRCGC